MYNFVKHILLAHFASHVCVLHVIRKSTPCTLREDSFVKGYLLEEIMPLYREVQLYIISMFYLYPRFLLRNFRKFGHASS